MITNILFVCHGNICRSPMAEFVLKDMVKKRGISNLFNISSAATSTEEIGNPVHSGTYNKLMQHEIFLEEKTSIQITKKDYKKYDYIIGMDSRNIKNIIKIVGQDNENKVSRLLDFTNNPNDIADPWYTRNFDLAYDSIVQGCEKLLEFILNKRNELL